MKRYRVCRLEDRGWDLVIEATVTLSIAMQVAEHASEHPTHARARVENLDGNVLAVFENGECIELNHRPVP